MKISRNAPKGNQRHRATFARSAAQSEMGKWWAPPETSSFTDLSPVQIAAIREQNDRNMRGAAI